MSEMCWLIHEVKGQYNKQIYREWIFISMFNFFNTCCNNLLQKRSPSLTVKNDRLQAWFSINEIQCKRAVFVSLVDGWQKRAATLPPNCSCRRTRAASSVTIQALTIIAWFTCGKQKRAIVKAVITPKVPSQLVHWIKMVARWCWVWEARHSLWFYSCVTWHSSSSTMTTKTQENQKKRTKKLKRIKWKWFFSWNSLTQLFDILCTKVVYD